MKRGHKKCGETELDYIWGKCMCVFTSTDQRSERFEFEFFIPLESSSACSRAEALCAKEARARAKYPGVSNFSRTKTVISAKRMRIQWAVQFWPSAQKTSLTTPKWPCPGVESRNIATFPSVFFSPTEFGQGNSHIMNRDQTLDRLLFT